MDTIRVNTQLVAIRVNIQMDIIRVNIQVDTVRDINILPGILIIHIITIKADKTKK